MKSLINFADVVRRSQSDRHDFPNVFTDDCGLDCKWSDPPLHAVPSWGHRPGNMRRRATVEITTFRGISWDAIHYYGTIYVQGVNMEYDNKPDCFTMSSVWEDIIPLSKYRYSLTLTRPISQEEIDADEASVDNVKRFSFQQVGDLTTCWKSVEDIVEFAKEVFRLRFQGDWEFYVKYPYGDIDMLEVSDVLTPEEALEIFESEPHGFEWYDPTKHKNKLLEAIRICQKTGGELDKTLHLMSNGEYMYAIYGSPCIHITVEDFSNLSNEL